MLNTKYDTDDDKGQLIMHPDAVLQMVRARVEANAVLQGRRHHR